MNAGADTDTPLTVLCFTVGGHLNGTDMQSETIKEEEREIIMDQNKSHQISWQAIL